MSFLGDLFDIGGGAGLGALVGSIVPGVGTALGAAIGGSLGGGLAGSSAAQSAAQTKANAANNATNTELQMFLQNQANLAPWMQSGQLANNVLLEQLGIGGTASNPTFNPNASLVAPFNASMLPGDPSYQWRLQQGENALLNQKNALGGLAGGNTLKAVNDYAQNQASTQYQTALQNYMAQQQNVYGRLAGISNTGVNAAGNVANLGANVAGQIGQNQIGAGNALAAGQVGSANALSGGLSQGINTALQQQYLNNNSLNVLLQSLQSGGGGNALSQLGGSFITNPSALPSGGEYPNVVFS